MRKPIKLSVVHQITIPIKSTKVLMPWWWQEPRAHAQLDALPY